VDSGYDEQLEKNLEAEALKYTGTEEEEALVAELNELEVSQGETPSSRGSYFLAALSLGTGPALDPFGHRSFDKDGLKADIRILKEKQVS